jgi:hypothetical protein
MFEPFPSPSQCLLPPLQRSSVSRCLLRSLQDTEEGSSHETDPAHPAAVGARDTKPRRMCERETGGRVSHNVSLTAGLPPTSSKVLHVAPADSHPLSLALVCIYVCMLVSLWYHLAVTRCSTRELSIYHNHTSGMLPKNLARDNVGSCAGVVSLVY